MDEKQRQAAMEWFELCEKATRYYLEERYPPGPPAEYTRLEIKHDLDSARELVAAIRERAGL